MIYYVSTKEELSNHVSEQLPVIPGGWKQEDVQLGDCLIQLTLPAVPDDLLEGDYQNSNSTKLLPDEGAPYWGYLWSAAKTMASMVLRHKWKAGTTALEIGSGIGLVGVAALKSGLQTTLTDYDPTSVLLAKHNAQQNGYPNAEVIPLQWEKPLKRTFPIILGCEVTYEPQSHIPLLDLLDNMLSEQGICWLGDGGRTPAAGFIQLAKDRNYQVSVTDANNNPLATLQRGKFQLLQLRKNSY